MAPSDKIQKQQAIYLRSINLQLSDDNDVQQIGKYEAANGLPELSYKTRKFTCNVPVNWHNPEDPSLGTIKLSLSILTSLESLKWSNVQGNELFYNLPVVAYLCGGPGSANNPEDVQALNHHFMSKGYQMLYMDYRGCGNSTKITNETIKDEGRDTDQKQFEYILHFRQDNIVRDLEAVRRCVAKELGCALDTFKFTLFGQSYGGWIVLTYLSFYSAGIKEAYINGGLAPIDVGIKDVYTKTYDMVIGFNDLFYKKYPDAEDHVRAIVSYLLEQKDGVQLPDGGGKLTARRFLCTGRSLGSPGGLEDVYQKVVKGANDIRKNGELSPEWQRSIKDIFRFNDRPLYALMHEPIYLDKQGQAAEWGASRAAKSLGLLRNFYWATSDDFSDWLKESIKDKKRLYFSGEHVYPWHFEGLYPGLEGLKDVADLAAKYKNWNPLYDTAKLRQNEVPVYALAFPCDMYVSHQYGMLTSLRVGKLRVGWRNDFFHASLKSDTKNVLDGFQEVKDKGSNLPSNLTYKPYEKKTPAELLELMP